MEKLINKKIQPFVEKHNVLPDFQHGFRQGRSTTTVLNKFSNCVNSALDQRKIVVVCLLDLAKCYDTLDHNILLNKLGKCGIRGKLSVLLKNYFTNRTQVTKLENNFSDKLPVRFGLVQGSILSTVFYNMYAHDLKFLSLSSSLFQYADDMAIVSIDNNIDRAFESLQSDLIKIQKWLYNNQIYMNGSKTKIMTIKSPHKCINLDNKKIQCHTRSCLNNNSFLTPCICPSLEMSDEERYLGIILDNKFKFKPHICKLNSKLRSVSSRIQTVNYFLPRSVKWILYKSLFESLMRYGLTIYGFASKSSLNSIHKLQQKIVRVLFNSDSRKEEIMSLQELQTYDLILKYFFHPDLKNKKITKYKLRKECYHVYKNNTTYGQRLPLYFLPTFLNNVTTDNNLLIFSKDMGDLKNNCKNFFDQKEINVITYLYIVTILDFDVFLNT
ncbi:hypothetical protein WDU94_000594 [Cyamophila willieti]